MIKAEIKKLGSRINENLFILKKKHQLNIWTSRRFN